jgi:hypothetical protein
MPNERPAGTNAIVRAVRSRPVPRRSSRLKAAALALGMTLAAGAVQWSVAQRGDALRIEVAPTIVVAADSQAPLRIEVGPREALPSNSFLRLRGFPRSVSLTEGHAIAPGSWAVPLLALGSLKAIVPAGAAGRTDIVITLVAVDGTTLAETRTALVVGPARVLASAKDKPPAEPPPKRLAPAPAPAPARVGRLPNAPELSTEDRARAERDLMLGGRHLEQGSIDAARSFFRRAAEAGLAAGALKMAATYDPAELARLEAVAVIPDRNKARKWYERARELGAPEAAERLRRLAGN